MNISIKIPFLSWSGKSDLSVLIDCVVESKFQLKVAVEKAVKNGADLTRANLTRANLNGANLDGASLTGASLNGANLYWASLNGASLDGARLDGASLTGASLTGASLYGASLTGASLTGANLYGAKNSELAQAMCLITPEGDIIGWKKCRARGTGSDGVGQKNVIVKLLIPKEAKRHNATGRKCRAEYAKVLEVFDGVEGVSSHDGKTKYIVGDTVRCDTFETNRFQECAGGIHFFLTRIEAENYAN